MHCKWLVLAWIEKHSMFHLEKKFLKDGERILDVAKIKLQNILFLGLFGEEWDEDRWKFGFENWIDN